MKAGRVGAMAALSLLCCFVVLPMAGRPKDCPSLNIEARTSSGALEVNRPVTIQGSVSRDHAQGKVGNGGVPVDLRTGYGDIQVD